MRIGAMMAFAAVGFVPLAMPAMLLAHTRVVASAPVQGATVKGLRVVTLTFSEALLPPTVATSIVMTAMPGVQNHGELAIRNFTSRWSGGNRTLTLSLGKPLGAGRYDVRWQAAGADGHRMTGKISFTVG